MYSLRKKKHIVVFKTISKDIPYPHCQNFETTNFADNFLHLHPISKDTFFASSLQDANIRKPTSISCLSITQ